MANHAFAGVVFNDGDSLLHLPLEKVEVHALIVDVSARVDVIQTFSNPAQTSTPRAKYVFPLPARAAVCAFEMSTSSGRAIVGVAQEKEQAKADFEQAMQQGKKTALVEWATNDVFTISIGSVAGGEQVTTTISYVLDLMDGDIRTEVRLQIPMCVGERYGEPPVEMIGASSPLSKTRVRFNGHIQTRGVIDSVTSPSHPQLSVAPYQTHQGRRSRHRAVATLRSPDYLYGDIVLLIKAAGLDVPRCFAERDPRGSGSLAMQLTLIPKFDLPPVPNQEFIFLVDRSGSMSGSRIEIAKRTLALLLRFLPGQRTATTFNVFSFGSHCDSLWPSSSLYSDTNVQLATVYADRMDANYGGTRIQAAIELTFQRRDPSKHTTIFVLTDGDVFDQGATARAVSIAVNSSSSVATLRVFTLGIGAGASSDMCESIASAGKGICLMAVEGDDLIKRCAKLVLTGRSILLKNVSVDWGVPPDATRQPQDSTAHAILRQAPITIESLYPGVRLVVFALIENARFAVPKTITLRAQQDGAGEVQIPVPVEEVRFSDLNETRLIHTLAARRLITDIADDAVNKHILSDEQRKAVIVSLGETYQLASQYTSFVAVEDDGKTDLPIPRPAWAKPTSRRQAAGKPSVRASRNDDEGVVDTLAGYINSALTFGHLFVTGFLKGWFGMPSTYDQAPGSSPGQWQDATQGDDTADREEGPVENDYDSDRTFSTLSSLISSESVWSDTESRPLTPDPVARSPSPDVARDPNYVQSQAEPTFTLTGATSSVGKKVEDLIRLQSCDGSFTDNAPFRQLIGSEVVDRVPPETDPQLWATALAVAFCQKHMIGQQELYDCFMEKILELVQSLDGDVASRFHALVEDAVKLL